jgi:hypothetical protein
MTSRIMQAYQQAPWRTKFRGMGGFLVAIAGLFLVIGLFLSISGQAATAGLELREMNDERESLRQEIASMRTNIANITSVVKMHARAEELGFKQVSPAEVIFLFVPGYPGRQTAVLAAAPGELNMPEPVIKPTYTESLWDWMFHGLAQVSGITGQ